jgi:hypothetical protein
MSYTQVVTPNPDIWCRPGWCLEYVNNAFGVDAIYGSATAAWEGSSTKHRDRNFPAGKWVPVWYGLHTTPLGHVVLMDPNGRVYSTSDLTNTPHIHPDLADLEAYYAYYGMTLQYRGWTEDVEGTPVLAPIAITAQGTTTKKEGFLMAVSAEKQEEAVDRILRYIDAPSGAIPGKVWEQTVVHGGTHSVKTELVQTRKQVIALTAAVTAMSKKPNLTAEQITDAVKAGLAEAVVDVDVNVIAREIEPRG